MKKLILLRHAKSSWKNADIDDFDRPLNDRGLFDAPLMGKLLHVKDVAVDLILCSSAARTRQTLCLFLQNYPFEGEIKFLRSLYHASAEQIRSVIMKHERGYKNILVVAHNPGLEDLLRELSQENLAMPTCALAVFEPAKKNEDLALNLSQELNLRHFWQPKLLASYR